MVDAYATSLGNLTLAIDAAHFILEDPASNSVLSLRPAVRLEGAAKPRVFDAVEGFSTSGGFMSVRWKANEGLEALCTLSLEEEPRFRLEFRLTNTGSRSLNVDSFHPIYIPPEGPGACALGMHELRILTLPQGSGAPRLRRVHGGRISNPLFGAWFSDSGQPMLLLGALEGESAAIQPVFSVEGARGRILHLSVECALGAAPLRPGESISIAPLRLIIGNYPVKDKLLEWAAEHRDSALVSRLKDFDPTGEIGEPEAAEGGEDPVCGAESNPSPAAIDETAGRAEVCATSRSEQVEAGTAHLMEQAETRATSIVGAERPLGRCALYRRALRANEGIWPRWAAGRRYAPLKKEVRGVS